MGNLQKGHGISFVDIDSDGDQDLYVAMGGAFKGDAYENSLYLNPGQNNNNWINISLEGSASNRAAIGAKIKVCFKDSQLSRSVYRDLNSGGSFGSNPFQQHIGIGRASLVDSVQIKWPVTGKVQVFKNLTAGMNIKIKEGDTEFTTQQFTKIDIGSVRSGLISCSPEAKK